LSACYIRDNNFSKAEKLRTLVIGNPTEGYSNTNLTDLTLGKNRLLETLDIRNCPNLTTSLNLNNCVNLLKLYAQNTSILGVAFAPSGRLIEAHLPGTLNTLSLRNLYSLTTLDVANYDLLIKFTCENTNGINSYDIVTDTIDTLTEVELLGIDWTVTDTSVF